MSAAPMIRFGTDGWRAVIADTFTLANVRVVCQAISEYLLETGAVGRSIAIGHDPRFMAERFSQEAAAVLAANGLQPLLPDQDLPTPAVAFGVVDQRLAGALMFTASHNPPEYNGIKFIPAYGGPASPEITSGIEAKIAAVLSRGEPPAADQDGLGRCGRFAPQDAYAARLRALIDFDAIRAARLKIAVDPMYGSGRHWVAPLLREAGAHVVSLHDRRDPLFGGSAPEPLADHLQHLSAQVVEGGADLGLATDGDADRFGVVDRDGQYLPANAVIALVLAHLVEDRKLTGAVVRTIATTHLIDRLAAHYGLEVHEVPVGFKYVGAKMREIPVVVGGEESGGLGIGLHIPEKDGILADLLVAELVAVRREPLCRTLERLMAAVGPCVSRRIDVPVADAAKRDLMRRLREEPPDRVGRRSIDRVIAVDGAKYVFRDGSWLLVRASGTEPLLRIYLEAPTPAELEALAADAQALVGL